MDETSLTVWDWPLYFIVISGLPASGKSTLAQRLANALGLPLLDKDTILESLYDVKGTGDVAWRRALSRESDTIFQADAPKLQGAVLVSHWRLPGMPADSGTPVEWLSNLPGRIIHVRCVSDTDIAAARFIQRKRHPGHLDHAKAAAEIRAGIDALAELAPLNIGPRVDVDTSQEPELDRVLDHIRRA